jgi:hypothetical protein
LPGCPTFPSLPTGSQTCGRGLLAHRKQPSAAETQLPGSLINRCSALETDTVRFKQFFTFMHPVFIMSYSV